VDKALKNTLEMSSPISIPLDLMQRIISKGTLQASTVALSLTVYGYQILMYFIVQKYQIQKLTNFVLAGCICIKNASEII